MSNDFTRPVCNQTCSRKIPEPVMWLMRAASGYLGSGVYALNRAASAGVRVKCEGVADGCGLFANAAVEPSKMMLRKSATRIDLTR